MKIIVAPDKFKHSLTSLQAGECIKAGVVRANQQADVYEYPMADGGDGFAEVMKYYLHTQTIRCNTVDPLGRPIVATYEFDAANKTAIIELASASGIVLLKKGERDPLHTSTYGTGLQVKHAIDTGATKIILGLGGSATTDAGTGILSALGFHFSGSDNKSLGANGESLQHITQIASPASIPRVHFIAACDVDNVMFGSKGAAFVFAPQKGADEKAVCRLDQGLRHFASVVLRQTGKDIANFGGAGAAGGVAAGLSAFFDVQVVSGAEMVVSVSGMEKQLASAGLLITGEGRIDLQTAGGKVVKYVASLAKKYGVPAIAFCGQVTTDEQQNTLMGLSAAIPIADAAVPKETAIKNAAAFLQQAAADYFR